MFMHGGGLSAGFGAAGHGRARVLSSPAGPVGMGGARGFGDGGGSLVYGTGPSVGHQTALQSQTHVREQPRGSEESSISRSTTAADNDAPDATNETLTTPASATPLLPAFLQDIVLKDTAGVSATHDVDDEEVLNGQKGIGGCTPEVRLIEDDSHDMRYPASMMPLGGGGTATPVPGCKYAPSNIGTGNAPTTTTAVQTPGSNAPMIHPRARNDSGSSTTSSSFSTSTSDSKSRTSSSTSTSLLSLPLSGSPPSSAACTPTNNASLTTTPNNTTSAGNPAGSNSSSGSSSGFYNFNLGIGVVSSVGGIGGGIWRMDGDESRNLGWAGSTSGSSSSSSSSSLKGLGQGYLHGNNTTTTTTTTTCAMAVQLPVGAERKGI